MPVKRIYHYMVTLQYNKGYFNDPAAQRIMSLEFHSVNECTMQHIQRMYTHGTVLAVSPVEMYFLYEDKTGRDLYQVISEQTIMNWQEEESDRQDATGNLLENWARIETRVGQQFNTRTATFTFIGFFNDNSQIL